MGRIADARGDSQQKRGNAAARSGNSPEKSNPSQSRSSLRVAIHTKPRVIRGAPNYWESGFPVVNSKHVNRGEVLIDADNRFAIVDENTLLIESGDVLINGTGVGTIGRAAPYLHKSKAVPDNHVTVLRPTDGIDPIYLSVFLNSMAGQLQVEQRLHGSSGQIELYPNDIAQFQIWLAPTAVQTEIRAAVQRSFEKKQQSAQLLNAAKRAVEIAIEESEAAVLDYLADVVREDGLSDAVAGESHPGVVPA